MDPINCNIPDKDIEDINKLIKKGKYPHRSEFIRESIRRLIRMEKMVK